MAERTAAGARSPAGLSRWQIRTVLIVLLSGQLLSALDQTIVGTALPTMVGEFGKLDSFSLVITSYLLTTTAATALYGKLGDLYGAKPVYMISIAVFTAGSLLVGLSQDMTQMVIFRAVQGAGAGGLVIMAFTISATVVPPRQIGRIQGLVGAMYALASLLGPLVGGALTQYATWRWCFLINVPIGVAGIVALSAMLKLPRTRREHTVDYLGAVLLVAAIAALVLATIWGGNEYPWFSGPILGLMAGVVALAVLFIIRERNAPEPIVPLALFRKPEISLAMLITFIVGIAIIGAYFFLPIYLQIVRGDGPTVAGLNLLPLMIAVMVGSGLSGWLISAVLGRMKLIVLAGVGIMTVSLYLLSILGTETKVWQLYAYEAVMGLGMGMVISKLIVSVQNSVSGRDIGTITAQAAFFRVIGSAIGTAAFGAVLAAKLSHASTQLLSQQAQAGLPRGSGVLYKDPSSIKELATAAPAVHHEVVDIFAKSLHTVFLAAVPLMLLALILTCFLPNTRLRDGGPPMGGPPSRGTHEVGDEKTANADDFLAEAQKEGS